MFTGENINLLDETKKRKNASKCNWWMDTRNGKEKDNEIIGQNYITFSDIIKNYYLYAD